MVTLRLTTIGRRNGSEPGWRSWVFTEDGPNIVVPAMKTGWIRPEPAWWLNLQAHPKASITLPGGETRDVTARATEGRERERLWSALVALGTAAYTDANAATRSRETAIVVFEPR